METEPDRPRSRFRVSLRVFMLLVLITGGWLGWQANRAATMRRAMAETRRVGGRAYFDHEISENGAPVTVDSSQFHGLERLLGPEYFHRIDTVFLAPGNFPRGTTAPPKGFAFLAGLRAARKAIVYATGADDAAMSSFPRIDDMKILEIQERQVSDAGLAWISQYQGLEQLDLVAPRMGDETARRVGRLGSLKSLELYGDGITDAGVEALSGLKSLTHLTVHGGPLGDRSLAAVAALPELRTLDLQKMDRATPSGFASLSRLAKLFQLRLAGASVGDWNMASLAGSKRLSTLSVMGGTLGPKSFSALPLPSDVPVTQVQVAYARVSDEAVANLERLISPCTIVFVKVDVSDEALKRLSTNRPTLRVVRFGTYLPLP